MDSRTRPLSSSHFHIWIKHMPLLISICFLIWAQEPTLSFLKNIQRCTLISIYGLRDTPDQSCYYLVHGLNKPAHMSLINPKDTPTQSGFYLYTYGLKHGPPYTGSRTHPHSHLYLWRHTHSEQLWFSHTAWRPHPLCSQSWLLVWPERRIFYYWHPHRGGVITQQQMEVFLPLNIHV